MNAKRILSVLLSLVLCSSMLLVACEKKQDEDDLDRVDADGDWIDDYVDLAEFKWEGEEYKEFNILIVSDKGDPTYYCEDVVPDLYSTTDDTLNAAVAARNDEIYNRYGVVIKATAEPNIKDTLEKDRAATLNTYDAALPYVYQAAPLSESGYVYNLNHSIFDGYLHLDQAWWDQKANASFSIGNNLFFTTGDISTMPKIVSTSITFNKAMLEKYFPGEDLYQAVRDKKWTFDKMVQMSTEVTADTDGKPGMTYEDTWGLSASYSDAGTYFIGAGKNYIVKTAADLPVLVIDQQASVTVAGKILAELQKPDTWVWHCDIITDGTQWVKSLDLFGQNRALFRTSAFSAIKKLRAYPDADEFGILPLPLVTAEQDKYYTSCGVSMAFVAVIPASLDTDRAQFSAYILDAMAFGGRKHITPAYYETTLKYRDLRDAESEEMLDDYIFNNIVYDLGVAYNFGSTTNAGVAKILEELMKTKQTSIASAVQSKKPVINQAIQSYIKAYSKYSQQ